jgi:hypothetical protein
VDRCAATPNERAVQQTVIELSRVGSAFEWEAIAYGGIGVSAGMKR